MAERMKMLEMVRLSTQNKCKSTRKFMEQNYKSWCELQRYPGRIIVLTSSLGKQGRVWEGLVLGCVSQVVWLGCTVLYLYLHQSTQGTEGERLVVALINRCMRETGETDTRRDRLDGAISKTSTFCKSCFVRVR